ncbi:MAG TPA: ribonuclease HI family protein [Bacteroidia bacterium]|nr:ribonuclease HI family protein [Bacteroidia bacterium]
MKSNKIHNINKLLQRNIYLVTNIHKNMLKIYTDGASRSNPGKAAIGIVIFDSNDKEVFKKKEYIGIASNNVAEYTALVKSLSKAKTFAKDGKEEIICYSDSELMIRQLNGLYKVKNTNLKELFAEVQLLIQEFKKVEFRHVKRENPKIQIADSLANMALDDAA